MHSFAWKGEQLRANTFTNLLVVFPGSCPFRCSAPQCLLPLIGSLRACPWPQDNLPPRPQILLRFSLCVRVVFDFFVAFCLRSKTFTKRMKGTKFTECKFWQNRCSVENHYLHIEYKKHWIVCTSALMTVLFILMSSRDAIELQAMW